MSPTSARAARSIASALRRMIASCSASPHRNRAWSSWNKIDLPPCQPLEPLDPIEAVAISATTGAGIDRSDRRDWHSARHRRSASRSSAGHQRAACGASRASEGSSHTRRALRWSRTSPKNFLCSISRKPAPRCRRSRADGLGRFVAPHLRTLLHRQIRKQRFRMRIEWIADRSAICDRLIEIVRALDRQSMRDPRVLHPA